MVRIINEEKKEDTPSSSTMVENAQVQDVHKTYYDVKVEEGTELKGYVYKKDTDIIVENAIVIRLHGKSRHGDELITMEYNDRSKKTYPLSLVMKQKYATLGKLSTIIDRKYHFNQEVAQNILQQISKIMKEDT